ncbi:MAG: STAS domain-containing protein [Deltaproteobacteria bacterium]|nr:STAS domain-containing protein [Deltaproteobacteria bacterium]
MEITTRKEKQVIVVSLQGRLDAVTAPELERRLSALIVQGELFFLLNMNGLEYISSAGLRGILATAKKLKEKQGKIVFAGLKGTVEEVFKISGFLSIFTAFDSEEAALRTME